MSPVLTVYTVPELARMLGASRWAIRSAADTLSPPLRRFAGQRVIPEHRVGEIRANLVRRGLLSPEGGAA